MAQLDYTAVQTTTRNQARLLEFAITRDVDAAGVPTGLVVVRGLIQTGSFTGGVFTELSRERFSETRTLAQVANFYGASVLTTMEQKTLERAQAVGVLPAGTIT